MRVKRCKAWHVNSRFDWHRPRKLLELVLIRDKGAACYWNGAVAIALGIAQLGRESAAPLLSPKLL